MARTYAGTLGLTAFLACLGRGMLHGSPAEAIVTQACIALVTFVLIGYAVGQTAAWIVRDAVVGLAAPLPATNRPDKDVAQTVL